MKRFRSWDCLILNSFVKARRHGVQLLTCWPLCWFVIKLRLGKIRALDSWDSRAVELEAWSNEPYGSSLGMESND